MRQIDKAEASRVVMLEAQIAEREGRRLSESEGERLWFDAVRLGPDKRAEVLAALEKALAETPRRHRLNCLESSQLSLEDAK